MVTNTSLFTGVPRIFEQAPRNRVSFGTTFGDHTKTSCNPPQKVQGQINGSSKVDGNSSIQPDPYTRCYETKITTESLLEEESKPAMMLSTQNILVPAELVDPTLNPKMNMLILTTCWIKSISLENYILDVD